MLRLKALDEMRMVKRKLKKKQIAEDMRQNYIYDILMERWKDRERKLEDRYQKFPGVNSFPVELRKPDSFVPPKAQKFGELPSSSKAV